MKSFLLLSLGFILFLNGCGEPSMNELNQTLEKAGTSIHQESWGKASEDIRTFGDYWNYVRSDFSKEDTKKVDRIIRDLENDLAVMDENKSKQHWQQLSQHWKKMNPQ